MFNININVKQLAKKVYNLLVLKFALILLKGLENG